MEFTMPWKRKQAQQSPPLPQSVSISGIHSSAVSVGTGNYTVQGSSVESGPAAAQLDEALAALRHRIQAQGGNLTQSALGQAAELDQAAKADPPDATVIARVRDWFERHLPSVLPAVLAVVAHPTIDAAIMAAGQIAQAEMRMPGPESADG
jgi:enamine deaminase RidA (YjgF/YER057c/UK114 family)